MIDDVRSNYMDNESYDYMENGVVYNSHYSLGGACLIKKAAEDIQLGFITAKFPDGTLVRRHYTFFSLMDRSLVQSLNFPLNRGMLIALVKL